MRLSELTERLFLDKSATSRVVQTLIKKGYVEQRDDATDRRAVGVVAWNDTCRRSRVTRSSSCTGTPAVGHSS